MITRRLKKTLAALLATIAVSVSAQIVTIDISSPTNPVVTYDTNPQLYAPDVPDDPTVIYMNALEIPGGTDTYSLEHAALVNEGMLVSMVNLEIGDYTAQEPQVITNEPDTYSLSPATVYYTAPTNEPPLVSATNSGPFRFDFGTSSSPVATGYISVSERTAYSATLGYGWGDTNRVSSKDRGVKSDPLGSDFCLPNGTPFYMDLPNGAYTVSVLSGDAAQKTSMSIRANGMPESGTGAAAGQYGEQAFPFTVTNGRMRLEFFGSLNHVNAITVTRVPDDAPHKPTIFVASDSTAAKYSKALYPLTGWGDRISYYLTDDVVVDDLAQAGRSSKSFVEEGWLDTIANRMHTNDYLFIMMAINDSASTGNRKTDPATTFKAYLRLYVNAARSHGAIPVFVTSQTKRTFDIWGRFFNSVGGYPQAMRDFGKELNVPVIDLNTKSIDYFTQVGPYETTNLFMYFPAGMYPGWPNGDADYIHFQDRGATALAGLVVDGIRELDLQPIPQFILSTPPDAPTGVVATPVSSTRMDLSWPKNPKTRSYNVKRANVSGGPFTTIATDVTETNFSDVGLAPATTYFYVVSAVNIKGESANSAEASGTTLTGPSAPPTGLTAIPGSMRAVLKWNASAGAASYNVKRATVSDGPYATIGSATTTNYSDTGVVNGTTYYYVVSSVNTYGESADSSEVNVKPMDLYGYWAFDETSGATARDSVGARNGTLASGATRVAGRINNAVQLDGSANGYVSFPAGLVSSLDDFSIAVWVRQDSLAAWSRIFDFGSGTGTYMFLTPDSDDGTVRFAMTTTGTGGEQKISTTSALSTGVWHHVVVTLSNTVGVLYLDGVEAGRNNNLTLKPSSLGNTTLNYLGKSQFADPNLPGALDDFRIYARALSTSEITALANGHSPSLAAPASVTATPASPTQINLSWTASQDAASYNVKRSTVSGGPYTVIASTSGTGYSNAGLAPNATYFYVVSAMDVTGESADSPQASATTPAGPPAPPAGLTAMPGDTRVTLKWNASAGASGYNVKRSTADGGPFTVLASLTGTNYMDGSVVNGTVYFYVVSSLNADGESANSSQVSAIPAAAPPALARYEFEGNANDTSGNGYNGADTLVSYVPGKVGVFAAQFNGSGSYVQIPRNIGTNFSLSLWVKTTDTGGTGAQWWSGKGLVDGEVSGSAADFGAAVLNSKFVLGIGSPDTTISTVSAINDGNWHHLAATRDAVSGAIRLYVDGVLNNSGTGPTGPRSSPPNLRIGSIQTGSTGGFLNGTVDEVRLYDRVLTDSEIGALATINTPPTISPIADQTVAVDGSTGPISFTVGDAETPSEWLTVSGTSSNPDLVPSANIMFGGTNSDRTIAVTPASGQSGTATITVTVSDGQASTNTSFNLTVMVEPPAITSQPQSQVVTVGSNATFTVTATGSQPLNYQWRFNGADIAGATGAGYTVADAQLSDAGDYSVVVANAAGTITSATATLTVNVNATFSGRAVALKANILGVTNAWSDTGSLPPSGGARESSLLTFNEPDLLAADVAHASTIGQADRTRSEASLANLALDIGGVTVDAEFAMARAEAIWQTNGTATVGDSQIANLFIAGQPIAVSGQPNQTVPLLNGAVIINEQIGCSNAITVNALHVIINGAADVIVSSAQAGLVSATAPSCNGGDYVSGGGWMTGTPGGAKGNFAIEAGVANGVYWGHLNYKDQGAGMQVKGTGITAYQPGATANSRHIEGTAQINGVDGYTFTIDAADNGEPGSQDTFAISLSNGYHASGQLGGGNIQLHQPCR